MAAPNFDADLACHVLLDAAFLTDQKAADKHGVSRRSVINYRHRLATDPEFAQLFTARLEELKRKLDWEGRLPAALLDAIEAMQRCFRELNPKNPGSLAAISQGLQVLADVVLTLRMLDARVNADESGAQAAPDRQVFGSAQQALA